MQLLALKAVYKMAIYVADRHFERKPEEPFNEQKLTWYQTAICVREIEKGLNSELRKDWTVLFQPRFSERD